MSWAAPCRGVLPYGHRRSYSHLRWHRVIIFKTKGLFWIYNNVTMSRVWAWICVLLHFYMPFLKFCFHIIYQTGRASGINVVGNREIFILLIFDNSWEHRCSEEVSLPKLPVKSMRKDRLLWRVSESTWIRLLLWTARWRVLSLSSYTGRMPSPQYTSGA